YFPITAMYSLVLNLDTGEKVEVATIGNEGFVGLPVYFRLRRSPYEAMLQVEGEILQVPAKEFFRLVSSSGVLAELISRFAIYSFHCANQLVACNAFHAPEELHADGCSSPRTERELIGST